MNAFAYIYIYIYIYQWVGFIYPWNTFLMPIFSSWRHRRLSLSWCQLCHHLRYWPMSSWCQLCLTYRTGGCYNDNVLRCQSDDKVDTIMNFEFQCHYNDVIMSVMASQITGVSIVYSTVCFQAQIKENIKAPRHWPFWGEFTGDRWIPRTKGQ